MTSSRSCSRRHLLRSAVTGSALFSGIVQQMLAEGGDPLAPRASQFPAKAKRVIFLFMTGGVSHIDTFDPKPALFRDHGKELKLLVDAQKWRPRSALDGGRRSSTKDPRR